jgi:hypothetical protein
MRKATTQRFQTRMQTLWRSTDGSGSSSSGGRRRRLPLGTTRPAHGSCKLRVKKRRGRTLSAFRLSGSSVCHRPRPDLHLLTQLCPSSLSVCARVACRYEAAVAADLARQAAPAPATPPATPPAQEDDEIARAIAMSLAAENANDTTATATAGAGAGAAPAADGEGAAAPAAAVAETAETADGGVAGGGGDFVVLSPAELRAARLARFSQ